MSTGAYSPDKALAHPERLNILRNGGQPYPVHLHIILSDYCQLDCPGCAYRITGYSSNQLFTIINPDGSINHNPNRMLKTDMVLGVLTDCVRMGIKAIEFTGGGEPTVHPDCALLIDTAQQLGIDTALISNGLLIPKKIPESVISKLFWLRISIDAATPKTFGIVRPGLGGPREENFYKAIDAVSFSRSVIDRNKSNCVLGAGFVVQKENWKELYDACRIYRDAGAHNIRISGIFTPEHDNYFTGFREEAEELERKAIADFDGKDGFRVYGRFSEKVEDLSHRPTTDRCWYEEFTTYLGGDGNLYRCCVTSYSLHGMIGNVKEAGGLKALWDSQKKKDCFDSFSAKSCDFCQFHDRLVSIENAVKNPDTVAPVDIQHANFV